mgnify:CR=1 FL=1
MKVFYAHGYHEGATEIDDSAHKLKELLQTRTQKVVRVRTGRNDHAANWTGCWDSWEHNVVHKKNLTTGKPVYDVFVASGERVGRATARILNMAIDAGKPVFWWTGDCDGGISKVSHIEEVDGEDWTWGWKAVCKPRKKPIGSQVQLPLEGATA